MIFRVFVTKKTSIPDVEARTYLSDLQDLLRGDDSNILKGVKIANRYDIQIDQELSADEITKICDMLAEKAQDDYSFNLEGSSGERILAIESIPGQYDVRADSAMQCIKMIFEDADVTVRVAKYIILAGNISDEIFEKICKNCINPVEARIASLEMPTTLIQKVDIPISVETVSGFIGITKGEQKSLHTRLGLAMKLADLEFCQSYFQVEKRDPTITEVRVIDTYWSDHCRHTTFLTKFEGVWFTEGVPEVIKEAYTEYLRNHDKQKPVCLMDLALSGMKQLKAKGKLPKIFETQENNACSIVVDVLLKSGEIVPYVVMFKNETHNHPTEIEPFGGAATCLGGAIRDPLSGRVYVYQAMRITGAGDPRNPIETTMKGKLPQKKITLGAANGYSSYGNQIGLATGYVQEIYNDGYIAKRLEVGAVIGAAPLEIIRQEEPVPGDVVILVGGRTGRDGLGGATGSSKAHTEESIEVCGAEVQKGNPPTERKIQKLFMNPDVSTLIKKCNDFGAGGVAVAIGEIAKGLIIDLDAVPKKYEGLDGTELAISESQERMAVVVDKDDAETFIEAAHRENLEATVVAVVTSEERLIMSWAGKNIVDISRAFLDTNGAKSSTEVKILPPKNDINPFNKVTSSGIIKELSNLNCCCQKGLGEKFDSTIGNGDSYLPYGGKYQLTPAQGMAAKIPVSTGSTDTCTIMTSGYNPEISQWSPFHGAIYAIVEALSKVVAMGGDYKDAYMSFQEYFPRLGDDPEKWGAPTAALLGAYIAQMRFGIAAIGGKDSMSGTFEDIEVPPTLIAFAVSPSQMNSIITSEFKKTGTDIMFIPNIMDNEYMPDFEDIKGKFSALTKDIQQGRILSARTVEFGSIGVALAKMCFGNMIGAEIMISEENLFDLKYGGFIIEVEKETDLYSTTAFKIGETVPKKTIRFKTGAAFSLKELVKVWKQPLEKIFPTKVSIPETHPDANVNIPLYHVTKESSRKPTVFMPIFPGTNCEIEMTKAFRESGANVEMMVIRNQSSEDIKESIFEMVGMIKKSQIIAFAGGFSAGDEPAGSAKFIATMLKNEYIRDAINYTFLDKEGGLIIGICNGFQALIKTGLVPYGRIQDVNAKSPTLITNEIGRHVSCLVDTKVISNLSPWLRNVEPGSIDRIPISHGEGRFYASQKMVEELIQNGQIATQYVDFTGDASMDIRFNPNGSVYAIEGITSPDGRILGKMGHSERTEQLHIFEAGVSYFK